MEKTALITGASSGIGYELSRVFAENGYHLVLVSRNAGTLEMISGEFRRRYEIRVEVMPKDLSRSAAAQELYDEVCDKGIRVDVLVNNAGIATHGRFTDIGPEMQMDLIRLNISSPTLLCRLFAGDMISHGYGKILNVASTAAFQAGPLMSTYYASKAYLLILSEALRNEFKSDRVAVTVLCPGPTRTEFFNRNNMRGTKLEKSPHIMTAAEVAEIGFAGLMKGKTIVIPGLTNKLLAFTVRLTPRNIVTAVAAFMNRK
jgi:hypothetical protein